MTTRLIDKLLTLRKVRVISSINHGVNDSDVSVMVWECISVDGLCDVKINDSIRCNYMENKRLQTESCIR